MLSTEDERVAQASTAYDLTAANKSPIATYDTRSLRLALTPPQRFAWPFVVADVEHSILSVDFLIAHDLIIDPRRRRLVHQPSNSIIQSFTRNSASCPLRPLRTSATLFPTTPFFDSSRSSFQPRLTPPAGTQETDGPIMLRENQVPAGGAEGIPPHVAGSDPPPLRQLVASPLHMVPNTQDRERRACGDYKALNAMTRPDRYPIRHVMDFHTKLHSQSIFSKIDLIRAFHQIPVADEDIPKTAVTKPFGLFEFPVMNVGLHNAAQAFQRFMDKVVRGIHFVVDPDTL